MLKFEVGMHVISMPSRAPCVIASICSDGSYPISVSDLSGAYEGSYTLEGFKFQDASPENKKFFIAIDYPIGNARPNINYWTIVRANSAFVQLSHPELQDMVIPIHTIDRIDILNNEPTLITSNYKLCLGPTVIQSVADALFTNEINSI